MNFKFNFCKIGSKKNFEFLAGDSRAVVEFKTTHNSIFSKMWVGSFLLNSVRLSCANEKRKKERIVIVCSESGNKKLKDGNGNSSGSSSTLAAAAHKWLRHRYSFRMSEQLKLKTKMEKLSLVALTLQKICSKSCKKSCKKLVNFKSNGFFT